MSDWKESCISNCPPLNNSFPRNYPEIISYLCLEIIKFCPNFTPGIIERVLFGLSIYGISPSGYLSNGISKKIKNENYNEIFEKISIVNKNMDNKSIIDKYSEELKYINYLFQEKVLKPILIDLEQFYNEDEKLRKSNKSPKYYQNKINELLGFNNVDKFLNNKGGYITRQILEEFKYRNYINFVKSDGYPRETTRNCRKYIKILNSEYTNTLYIKPCLKESKYEVHTLNVLNSLRISDKNIIDIEREKTFKDGKFQNSNSNFRFDFYLKVKNKKDFLIEVDGQQHFNFTKNWQKTEEKFLNHKQNDIIKDRYVKEKGLKLLRI